MVEPIIRRRGRTPKASPSALASRLVAARLKIGTTQKELAERLRCGWRSIQDYEQDRAVPGGAVIAAYGELGIDLNWLLTGTGEIEAQSDSEFVRVPHFQLNDVNTDFSANASSLSVVQINRLWLRKFLGEHQEEIGVSLTASIIVEDDSMTPEVPKGTIVIFYTSPVRPDTQGLYVFPLGNQLAVRLVRTTFDNCAEIIELRHPARPIIVENSSETLPTAYRVIAILSAQIASTKTFE